METCEQPTSKAKRRKGEHRRSKRALAEKRTHIHYDYASDTTMVLVDGICVLTVPGFDLDARAQAVQKALEHEPLLPPDEYQRNYLSGADLHEPEAIPQFPTPWESNEAAQAYLEYRKERGGTLRGGAHQSGGGAGVPSVGVPDLDAERSTD